MKKKRNVDLTKDEALNVILKHLKAQIRQGIKIRDGIPEGYSLYGVSKNEPCWTAWIPSSTFQVGAGRIICISKRNDKVIFDGLVGE